MPTIYVVEFLDDDGAWKPRNDTNRDSTDNPNLPQDRADNPGMGGRFRVSPYERRDEK